MVEHGIELRVAELSSRNAGEFFFESVRGISVSFYYLLLFLRILI